MEYTQLCTKAGSVYFLPTANVAIYMKESISQSAHTASRQLGIAAAAAAAQCMPVCMCVYTHA